ncbi:TlpA family protein disulfide reductase [Salinimicrobium sediminilitoris]|uniref:TlpA family protein disulfide reductase n=1 Tax=Salinimicrobium sediminilitoris TaxID=2876715 RepID=UPI001E32DF15|nr:TlpA disulfide reductase family protein [Salinimicrobium sediminilitoris]MCC8358860.1 TlpA family protein disulfide reductase [Salinimicrobium sediminilitoris]
MEFLKKNWSNILFIILIVLLIIPQTRKPIQVTLNRIIAFSPSKIAADDRETLEDYNWNLTNLQGEPVNFKKSIGEVAVINLWATWCPPCIAEMPSFQKLYNEYGDKVDFYFVSTEDQEKLQRFLDKKNYRLPVYQPLSMAPQKLQSRSLPTTYVISRDGKIAVNKKGSANWNDAGFKDLLDQLLKEN